MRVHVIGIIVWNNKTHFDLVQNRLEPRPFVCASQLLPEIGNARYAALCRRNQTKCAAACALRQSVGESAEQSDAIHQF